MAATQTFPLVSDATLEELSMRGEAIYETLRAQLEAQYNAQYVVIHVENGDYAVGRTFTQVNREMLGRHGTDGKLFARKIGTEPDQDSLAVRLLPSGLRAERQK